MLTAENVYRDFVTDGVPSSGQNKVKKSEIRELLTGYETVINAFTSNSGVVAFTRAQLYTLLSPEPFAMAWVLADPDRSLNGIYQRAGTDTPPWHRIGDLPYSFIKATDAGAGTANAIVATSSIPVNSSALIALNIFETNTGPTTVAFNGGNAYSIKTNNGNDVLAGYLVAGAIVAGYISGGDFRLISDVATAADRVAAEAAAAAAAASVASIDYVNVADRAAMAAIDVTAHTTVYLKKQDREGIFNLKNAADYTALIAADTAMGIFVPSTNDATKVWVRVWDWIYPEWFVGDATTIAYCPAGQPSDYSTGTDFAPAFTAMRAVVVALLQNSEWPPTSIEGVRRAPFGLALRPGRRYAISAGCNFTDIRAEGLQFCANGATLVGTYANGAPMVDLIGSSGWTTSGLRCESDSGAQPSFGILWGRKTQLSQAADMTFNECDVVGWFAVRAGYNFGGEVSSVNNSRFINYNATPAFQIDSVNEVGIETYTQCAGVTIAGASNVSCIMHSIHNCSFRAIQETPLGAFRITSALSDTEHNAVRKVNATNLYVTNNGNDTDTVKPGVVVSGCINDLHLDVHGELRVANAEIELSHLVYYDTSGGAQVHQNHTIIEHLSDAEVGTIGKHASNNLTITGLDLRVAARRGTGTAGAAAKLFGPGMANASLSGRAIVGADANLLNFDALAAWTGDIFCRAAYANLLLPASAAGRYIRGAEIISFGNSGTWTPTAVAVANLDGTPVPGVGSYARIGNEILGSVRVSIDPTAASETLTSFTLTLPVASNFTNVDDASGTVGVRNVNQAGAVSAVIATDLLLVEFAAQSTSSQNMQVIFRYTVK